MSLRLLLGLASASVLLTVAFAAPAQTNPPTHPTAIVIDGSVDGDAAGFDASEKRGFNRHCLRQTGSRITTRANAPRAGAASATNGQQRNKRCVAANGRVYSREDLDRTGEVDIADALRKLDPAIY